jgi:hypothetical protein
LLIIDQRAVVMMQFIYLSWLFRAEHPKRFEPNSECLQIVESLLFAATPIGSYVFLIEGCLKIGERLVIEAEAQQMFPAIAKRNGMMPHFQGDSNVVNYLILQPDHGVLSQLTNSAREISGLFGQSVRQIRNNT